MSETVDKVIVINRKAMSKKYSQAGTASIEAALVRLIQADMGRNLISRVVAIDDEAEMAAVGGQPVIGREDEAGAKGAVDAIYATLMPDYIMLLDGPDVVPHITLKKISGLNDDDQSIPSDLPYACSAGYSERTNNFLGVDRVVGRLPVVAGETNPDVLVLLIDTAARHKPRPKADHLAYFAISAEVWTESTQLSLSSIFQNHTGLDITPPAMHPVINAGLGRHTHFINCHGADIDPRFYGQHGDNSFPVALESIGITLSATAEGLVAAAECCFGAQLYDYNIAGFDQPICQAYMRNKAAAFLGSTNIAYGAVDKMAQADLMCRFFIEGVLGGASTGRALLQARQQFVEKQVMADPTNLKTLAQFILLGDPSLQPVESPPPDPSTAMAEGTPKGVAEGDVRGLRKARRVALSSFGKAVASAASLPGRASRDGSSAVERFGELALEQGYSKSSAFRVTGGREFRNAMKARGQEKQVMIAVKQVRARAGTSEEAAFGVFRVMIGHANGDGLKVIVVESR